MNEEETITLTESELTEMASKMRGNELNLEDHKSIYTFLFNVAQSLDTTKTGNLRDDKDINELGKPMFTVRGAKELALISSDIIENTFFSDFFTKQAEITLSSSLSREGFLIRQGTTQTKQVADITKRRRINKGWFGKQSVEEVGGDTLKN